MDINNFISKYKNHPVLFIGTGISLRYLEKSYTWDALLEKIAFDLTGNEEFYLDIKSRYYQNGEFKFEPIAEELENAFNLKLTNDRNGKFKEINDLFFANMKKNINISRFRLYIAYLLSDITSKESMQNEIIELKKARKNISSIITTNYDKFLENIFDFNVLIGNNILLSNPYGSLYKIHGCVDKPDKIIITDKDYKLFNERYELIRAQLLSLFIHNPIIFIGYSLNDENIKSLLKTIFTYVEANSIEAERIRSNFLLVEFEENSMNTNITEHDIDIVGFSRIRINKIKTDNYIEIYKALSNLQLPVSAMDIRKVQTIVKDIYTGGSIKVNITEDLNELENHEKILAIGSKNTISYQYNNPSELITKYFSIVDESNNQILNLIDKFKISKTQYFPIMAFTKINPNISCKNILMIQQKEKLESYIDKIPSCYLLKYNSIIDIFSSENIPNSSKEKVLIWNILHNNLELNEIEVFLRNYTENKNTTSYKRLICAYDFKKHEELLLEYTK
ncbi:MAG: SIR2 family protein [Sarcina sp.]